jgi:hypothetical protein
MHRSIQTILNIKTIFVFILLLSVTLLTDFIYYDYITTEEVLRKYKHEKQVEQEAKIYNEHDDLMADFKDDLAEIELEATGDSESESDSDYFSDTYFNITYDLSSPILICLSLTLFAFIGFQFVKNAKGIRYTDLLKATTFAYFLFPISKGIKCIWFGLFQSEYQMQELHQMEKYLNPSIHNLLNTPEPYQWYNYLFMDINLQHLLFALLIPLFLQALTQLKYWELLKKMLIPFSCFFIVFHIVSPYKFYLIYLFN